MVEANQFVATASGSVSTLSIYLDGSNRATSIGLALYSDAAGVPAALLAQGSRGTVQNGGWNSVTIPTTTFTSGTRYWIARLALAGGSLVTRVDPVATNPDRSDSRTVTTFPASFSPAGSWPHRTSMYAGQAPDVTPGPSATPTPTNPATPIPTASPGAGTVTIDVDGAVRFQTIDGFGVNATATQWESGALRPAIDMLFANGARIWRVDAYNSHSNWEATNDDADPFHFNWNAYNALYTNASFQNLWSMVSYLESKGATVELTLSGLVPSWMGGTAITAGMEDEFVEQVVSLVYYGRNTRGIRSSMVSPLNETDQGPPEGPNVGPTQYVSILSRLATRLDSVGLSDVEIVGPHTANAFDIQYTTAMLASANVMRHVRRFSFHNYAGGGANHYVNLIGNSPYSDRHVWLGEWNQCRTDGCLGGDDLVTNEWAFAREMTEQLLTYVEQGANAALAWDAWDNWHEHMACCPMTYWGSVRRDAAGTYQPKKRLFTNAQVFRFVTQGMTRVSSSVSSTGVSALAFTGANGSVTIVGQNPGGPATLSGSLRNVPTVGRLEYYRTTATEDLVRGADVAVSSGRFQVGIPGDSFFTLTWQSGASPSPTPSATPTGTPAPILGDNTIESTADGSALGTVEANQFIATASGSVNLLSIYLDSSNRATSIGLALYSDVSGVPGALLAQGSRSSVLNGAWNSVSIPSTVLTAGTRYWIARLARAGGNLVTRIDPTAADPDRTDTRFTTTFPPTFSPAGSWPHRTSMYASSAVP